MQYKYFKSYLAEFMASFIYGIAYNFAVITKVESIALVMLGVKCSIGYAFENLTLKHCNPSVTLGCTFIGLLNIYTGIIYVLFQVAGFICSAGIARLLYHDKYIIVYQKMQAESSVRIFLLEFFVNLLLGIIIIENIVYATGLIQINKHYTTLSYQRTKHALPFSIGLTSGVGAFIASVASGGVFNSGIVFSVYLITNHTYNHFASYICGEMLGSIAAAFLVTYCIV